MGVEADYLATAMAEMKAQYGSIDGYLEKAVGLDAAGREAGAGAYPALKAVFPDEPGAVQP